MSARSSKQCLGACFRVRANLGSSIAAVKRELGSFPCLELLSYGSKLSYLVKTGSQDLPGPLLELSDDSIVFLFFFSRPDAAEYGIQLLRFMSMLAYLNPHYSVDPSGLYGYVIEALRNRWSLTALSEADADEVLRMRVVSLSGINASLSRELVSLSGAKASLERKAGILLRFCSEVLEGSGVLKSGGAAGSRLAFSSLGVGRETTEEVLSLLKEERGSL